MKVEVTRDKLLTNYEVLDHIAQVKQRHRAYSAPAQHSQSQNFQTIILEVQRYLQERPTGRPGHEQKKANIEKAVRALVPMGLEKAEILQIINSAPASLPVLFALIEECEQRLSEDQQDEILLICKDLLGEEPIPG